MQSVQTLMLSKNDAYRHDREKVSVRMFFVCKCDYLALQDIKAAVNNQRCHHAELSAAHAHRISKKRANIFLL